MPESKPPQVLHLRSWKIYSTRGYTITSAGSFVKGNCPDLRYNGMPSTSRWILNAKPNSGHFGNQRLLLSAVPTNRVWTSRQDSSPSR